MNTRLASATTAKTLARLTGSKGMNSQLAALTQAGEPKPASLLSGQTRATNATAEVAEKSDAHYPNANIYCERITNSLREKFRSFSGSVRMAVEVRHSQDHLEGMEDGLERYADAIAHTLDAARGDWGDGMYYAGGYEVSFGPVKQGGRGFVQTAKVTFDVGVSRN
jgi:hypothetical protein